MEECQCVRHKTFVPETSSIPTYYILDKMFFFFHGMRRIEQLNKKKIIDYPVILVIGYDHL